MPQFIDTHELPGGHLLALLKPFNNTQRGKKLVFIDSENFTDRTRLRRLSSLSDPLVLSNAPSFDQAEHDISYCDIFFNDNKQTILLGQGVLQDNLVPATDPLFQTDANGVQVLNAQGNPIPAMVTATISATTSTLGAVNSDVFFSLFETGTHTGRLTSAELRLIYEWLDIGAQYYNNPLDAPIQ